MAQLTPALNALTSQLSTASVMKYLAEGWLVPFYFRKSVSAGPFRFNLSSSGVGMSVGIKGLRFGTGPRGHYVHAGRGGLYYRASLGGGEKRSRSLPKRNAAPHRRSYVTEFSEPNVDMIRVSSADVMTMSDERYDDLLSELNAKQTRISLAWTLGSLALGLGVISAIGLGPGAFIAALVLAGIAAIFGAYIDTTRRSAVVLYNLEPDAEAAYENFTTAFDRLAASSRKWHIDSGGKVRDLHTWKRNAGASTIVDKRPTQFAYGLPRVLKSNVTPPTMQVGKETIFFLPDLTLVVESGKVGAVAYDSLRVAYQDSRFIEDGGVPHDAEVVGETWEHPNKNGGPDRRFANNRRLPICLYEYLHLSSANGLNELLQVSTNGRVQPFALAVSKLAATLGKRGAALSLPPL